LRCESLGGYLAQITSAAEHTAVSSIVRTDVWIGLNDRTTEGTFEWQLGGSATAPAGTYLPWETGEPNASGDCVLNGASDSRWYDRTCSDSEAYVCERP
jgi:hypothetical protein